MAMRDNTDRRDRGAHADADSVLLKAIVEAVVDAIVVIDELGRICMANPATERLFGYQLGELVGENVAILMPEPYHSHHDGYLDNYLNTGRRGIIGVGREVSGRHRDGSTFPIYLSVAEVHADDRRLFAGIIHDLSARKAIENALRESEQRLRDVTEAASDWTWEMDEQFRLIYVSQRFYELTGVSARAVVGRARWELAADDPESPVWRRHRDDLEHHRRFRDFVYSPKLQSTPGREFYFKISGKPVFDEAGQFCGYRGTGTDVTDRVVARRALRESRSSLDALMSNLPGMVYRCRNDRDWTMMFVSQGAADLVGYRPDELVGEGAVTFASLIHPEDRDVVWNDVQMAVGEGRPFELSYRICTATGEEKWVWEHGRPVDAKDGEPAALEGLILDISERRQTESALRALAGSTALGDGEGFVAGCVRELARTYGAQYAFVGVFADAMQNVHRDPGSLDGRRLWRQVHLRALRNAL